MTSKATYSRIPQKEAGAHVVKLNSLKSGLRLIYFNRGSCQWILSWGGVSRGLMFQPSLKKLIQRSSSERNLPTMPTPQTKFSKRIKTSFRTLIRFITVENGVPRFSTPRLFKSALEERFHKYLNAFPPHFHADGTQTEFLILKPFSPRTNQFAGIIIADVILIFFSVFRSLFYPFMAALQTRFGIF